MPERYQIPPNIMEISATDSGTDKIRDLPKNFADLLKQIPIDELRWYLNRQAWSMFAIERGLHKQQ